MKSFRKVLLIITVIALLCVLVACGENAGTGSTPNQANKAIKVADRAVKNKAALRLNLSIRRI